MQKRREAARNLVEAWLTYPEITIPEGLSGQDVKLMLQELCNLQKSGSESEKPEKNFGA